MLVIAIHPKKVNEIALVIINYKSQTISKAQLKEIHAELWSWWPNKNRDKKFSQQDKSHDFLPDRLNFQVPPGFPEKVATPEFKTAKQQCHWILTSSTPANHSRQWLM